MTAQPASLERLHELLADEALQGLGHGERDELAGLLERFDLVDASAFERAAAAIDVAMLDVEPMPIVLTDRLTADAMAWLARDRGPSVVDPSTPAT